MKLILASASPRRKWLLEQAGYHVTCVPSGAEEIEDDSLPPAVLALENASRKVAVVAARHPSDIVLAADTVVWMNGRFFGKPADLDEAARMLASLAGNQHEVVTGVVALLPGGNTRSLSDSSLVTFHRLDQGQIAAYLASINPLDKAGGYAAQDDDGRLIARIEGLRSNVIGLPVERLPELLHAHQPRT